MKKLFAIALLALAGCASIGAVAPQSFDQSLAYGYGTVTAVRVSAAQALEAHSLKVTDAQEVLVLTDTAKAGLDTAKVAAVSGDTSTASAKLALALGVLTQAQQFLIAKGVK